VPMPREHEEGQSRWVYPVMEAVIEGIERGDKASVAVGIDFIEEDALSEEDSPFASMKESVMTNRLGCCGLRWGFH
jgi:hypothetical protein